MTSSPRPASPHARTRRDHATELAEDYVEAIDDLVRTTGKCRVTDLAKHFGVSHVTVNRTVARLVRDGYVQTEPYGPVTLTPTGQKTARTARTRHEIVERFLRALGVGDRIAAIDAEGIEHHVSAETLRAMERFANEHKPAPPTEGA